MKGQSHVAGATSILAVFQVALTVILYIAFMTKGVTTTLAAAAADTYKRVQRQKSVS